MLQNTETKQDGARRPIPSGKAFKVEFQGKEEGIQPGLSAELEKVLERFATEAGFQGDRPVTITFKPGIVGHHKIGRAADIYAVGGVGIDRWKDRWDEAMRRSAQALDPAQARTIGDRERRENLGWRLYKALQIHGRWSQPYGYPIQLFGPWTRTEGPWRFISDKLLQAHRDHIHVAR